MGAGASAKSRKPTSSRRSHSPSVLLPLLSSESESERLPEQLFVEGAGSVRANGKFILRTDNDRFPMDSNSDTKQEVVCGECDRGAWFVKENDACCWMGYVHTSKKGKGRKWIIFAAREILYVAAATDETLSPRQGRWEVGDVGEAPAPTVNVKPLPSAFRLIGWREHNYQLNGEYLPLDDGSAVFNDRPIFKHTPVVVGLVCPPGKLQMYWSHGAWRITDKDIPEKPTNHAQLQDYIAFVESDATHPTDIPPEVVWKQPGRWLSSSTTFHKEQRTFRKVGNNFAIVQGVSIEAGTVCAPCWYLSDSLLSVSLPPSLSLCPCVFLACISFSLATITSFYFCRCEVGVQQYPPGSLFISVL